jgi:hypothetical protein
MHEFHETIASKTAVSTVLMLKPPIIGGFFNIKQIVQNALYERVVRGGENNFKKRLRETRF